MQSRCRGDIPGCNVLKPTLGDKACHRLDFKGSLRIMAFAFTASTALAGELVINSDMTDPAPKKAMEDLVADYEAAHPDVKVKWNNFDHEGYKSAIRNFLTADPPALVLLYVIILYFADRDVRQLFDKGLAYLRRGGGSPGPRQT